VRHRSGPTSAAPGESETDDIREKKNMKNAARILLAVAITLAAGVAGAEEESQAEDDGSSDDGGFGLMATIGETIFIIDGDGYRGPVSLEVVPSLGWSWLRFDLGLSTTLESLRIAGTSVGHWNFTFRPGGRLTPPMIPAYFRVAFPLQLQRHDFDWGVLFGLGLDIPIVGILALIFEFDTTLSRNLEWGGWGVPLEFRGGVSLHF
jgi:hypothetical protein